MSSLFVHVGQCGNQLSLPLWNNFLKSQINDHRNVFASLDHHHHSLHIDSEPKVIRSLPKHFKIRSENVIVGKRGRGTNFALGYYGLKSIGDDHVLENVIESSRREIERCDSYSGAIVVHSLSGGTGSGLGCRVIETLRDEYPCKQIMSCAVLPYESGESPLQSYNSLLALHWLQNFTDCVVLLQNDALSSHLTRTVVASDDGKQISFQDMNQLAGNQLSGIFLPTDTLSTARGISINQEPWELVRTLTPMPSTKFISLIQHTSSKLGWDELIGKTLQRHPKFLSSKRNTRSLGATIIARGDSNDTFLSCVKRGGDKKIKKSLATVDWNPYPLDCWTAKMNSIGGKGHASLTLAVNSSNVLDAFATISTRAGIKLSFGAYMHWYRRYGMTDEIFEESIETLNSVIENYKEATEDGNC